MLGKVEQKDENVRIKVYIVFGRVCVRVTLDVCICSRTNAGIRRHADKEHYEKEPKT